MPSANPTKRKRIVVMVAGVAILSIGLLVTNFFKASPESPEERAFRLYEEANEDEHITDEELQRITEIVERDNSGWTNLPDLPGRIVILAEAGNRYSFQANTYWPSHDYVTGLALEVISVEEGEFPHEYVGISCHSGVILASLMGVWDGWSVRLCLVWDDDVGLYKLVDFRRAKFLKHGAKSGKELQSQDK